MRERLVAPCGMNCNVCAAYLACTHDVRSKGIRMMYCKGCMSKKRPCAFLKQKCKLLRDEEIRFCYMCPTFPCDRLSSIDKLYRTNFRMSEIENLSRIRAEGIKSFLKAERRKWKCHKCGGVISCHNGLCFDCDLETLRRKKRPYRWSRDSRRGQTGNPG
ncbi:MAG: DUF3795 domain-containing protein [Thermoplasmata archaeon]|jgi:hypothetical protein|nr:DUF3795 domain-containing protein [Thermoplasmata archaeon]